MYDQSLFPDEVQRFFERDDPNTYYYITAIFKTPEKDIPVFKVKTLTEFYNYGQNIAGDITLEVFMAIGDYMHIVQPGIGELKLQLIYSPVAAGAIEEENIGGNGFNVTYIAKPKDRSIKTLEANVDAVTDSAIAEDVGMQYYKFQLVEGAVYYLRNVEVGDNYFNCVPGDVIRHLLDRESARIKGDDTMLVKGVDMVAYDNQKPRPTLVIPHGTPLLSVPTLVQNKLGGVYATGLDYFFQRSQWYVWPTFNVKRFNDSRRSLTIVVIPTNKAPHVDRTFFIDSGNVFILSTGKRVATDNSDSLQMNHGNGIRFTDARKIVEGFGISEGNKYTIDRSAVNNEYLFTGREDRQDYAPVSGTRITSNPLLESSKIAKNNTLHVAVSWHNADPTLLYPGMPVKYIYQEESGASILYGSVIGAEYYTELSGGTLMSTKHMTNANISLLLGKDKE